MATSKQFLAAASLLFVFLLASSLFAQEPTAPAVPPGPEEMNLPALRLQDLESLAIEALRQEMPRFSGILTSAHSCHLPDYGPLISITIQAPPFYFTRPVLMELERRQRIAEDQARKFRVQIDRAAQILNLKAKEADLQERLDTDHASKRKGKGNNDLEKDLAEVRKSLTQLQSVDEGEDTIVMVADPLNDMDLNKMMMANYQQMIQKLAETMKNTLAVNGVRLSGLQEKDRICIATHIRENLFGDQGERSIIFVLKGSDIQAFRNGTITLPALREKVLVKEEEEE